jgi:hypothetical protein
MTGILGRLTPNAYLGLDSHGWGKHMDRLIRTHFLPVERGVMRAIRTRKVVAYNIRPFSQRTV